ncbi:MAG TPA: hypothetical protein VM577_06365 [Anaerovoracaceae bacterium]|nr:hypothetical protein [Anaerovoracaceae bacterium]
MSKWLGGMTFMGLVWGSVHITDNPNVAVGMIAGLCCLAFFAYSAGAEIW